MIEERKHLPLLNLNINVYSYWFIPGFYPFHNLYFGKHPLSYNNVINFPAVVIIAPTQTVYNTIRWYFTRVQNKTSQKIKNYHKKQNIILIN